MYHTIHPSNSASGESAVIVKESINHFEKDKYTTEEIQATTISIETSNYTIAIAGLYCPPRHSLKKSQYRKFFNYMGNRFIVGGDFNAKNIYWGSRLTTTKGKELLEAIKENNCETLSTGKPTYWPSDPTKIPDLIDFFITKSISKHNTSVNESQEMNSDHSPIVLIVSEEVIQREKTATLSNNYTDWEYFKKCLDSRLQLTTPLQSIEELDAEAEQFAKDIQQSAWESTPEIKNKLRGYNYPQGIKILLSRKRAARNKWHQTRAPCDLTIVDNQTKQLSREIQRHKNDTISTYFINLSNSNASDYSL